MDRDTIFISHATPHDNDFVRWLGERLAAHGYAVWADVFHLKGGTPFWTSIEEVLRKRAVKVIFVVSSHSIDADRGGVRNELSVADGLRKSLKDPEFIVPLRIDETPFDELPIQIHQLNTLDFSRDWDVGLPDLLDTLECARVPRTSGEPRGLRGTAPATAISLVPFNTLSGDPKQPFLADEVVDSHSEEASPQGPESPSVVLASPSPALALPDKPSVAVLPFANLSNDPDQEYFADGLTEDIITALSRLRWFFVIARNSTFAYKGKALDVRQIASDLGVRYVLEGSVRKAGDHLRVTSQLIDASTGAQVWAERYDRVLADIFAVQDEITTSVVASIEPQLYEAEILRFQCKPPESLDAWGYVMRAMPLVWTSGTEDENKTAAHLLARAIEIDPNYAQANSLLAQANATRAARGWGDPSDALATALSLAQRAIAQDRRDAWGHMVAGQVHVLARRFKPAVDELQEAIAWNPNLSNAHMTLALAYGYGGRPDEGLAELAVASRLNPRDQNAEQNAAMLTITGLCHLMAKRFPEAVEFERRAVEVRPSLGTAWRTLAAAAGLAGDVEIAASALAEAKRLQPSLSLEWVEKYHPIVRAEDRAIYLEGLQKAGLR